MANSLQSIAGAVQAGSSIVLTFPSPTTAGSGIIVIWGSFFSPLAASIGIADNNSSSFAQRYAHDPASSGGAQGVWSALGIAGRSGHQVTINFTAGNYMVAMAVEVANLSTFDQASTSNAQTIAPAASPSLTPNQAASYLAGFIHHNADSTSDITAGTGWTGLGYADDGSFHQMYVEDQLVSPASASQATYGSFLGGTFDSALAIFAQTTAAPTAVSNAIRKILGAATRPAPFRPGLAR